MIKPSERTRKRVGGFLRDLREQHGMSQRELAEQCGYSGCQYISRVEHGIVPPSERLLDGVRALGLPVSVLIDAFLVGLTEDLRDFREPAPGKAKGRKRDATKATGRPQGGKDE